MKIENVPDEIETTALAREVQAFLDLEEMPAVSWHPKDKWVKVDADISEADLHSLIAAHDPDPLLGLDPEIKRTHDLLQRFVDGETLKKEEEAELVMLERKYLLRELGF